MKKLMIILTIVLATTTLFAKPHHNSPRLIPHRPIPSHCPSQHHSRVPHHNNWIGPTIIGSVILGSAIINATTPKTVIVQQPIVTQKTIWIEGHYETQIINNVPTRVWIPGRYILVNN